MPQTPGAFFVAVERSTAAVATNRVSLFKCQRSTLVSGRMRVLNRLKLAGSCFRRGVKSCRQSGRSSGTVA